MTMPAGRRRAQFPVPEQQRVAPAEPARVLPLVFALSFPGLPGCPVDLSSAACPQVARELGLALWELAQVGGRVRTRATAYTYLSGLRHLDAFLATQLKDPGSAHLAELTPQLLDAFEVYLYEKVPVPRSAYGSLAVVVALLRRVRDARVHLLDPQLPARLRLVGRRPCPRPTTGVDAYPAPVVAALRAACREQIRRTVRRLTVEGPAVLAEGCDPREAGWRGEPNRLWEINRTGVLNRDQLRVAVGWKHPAGVRGLRDLHRLLYPDEVDLAAIAMLLILETGLEPESVRELAADCLRNPHRDYVEIEYLKRRRHRQEWNRLRVRDGNAATAGGLVRLAIRLTSTARERLGSTALWTCYQAGTSQLVVSHVGVHERSGTAVMADRYALRDIDGSPLSVDLRRLRKSHKAEFYRATGGQLPLLAQGHSREVAASRYADIPALRDVHETAIADGLSEALHDARRVRVLGPVEEQRLATDPGQAPQLAGVRPDQVKALLSGEFDLWLSACRDFTDSPFGSPGQPCPVPFWHCLGCDNAVITSRKLPTILAFLDHITAQRAELPAQAWAVAYGQAYQRIVTQVLPAFPTDIVLQAKAIAEATRPLAHLPALAFGIGARA